VSVPGFSIKASSALASSTACSNRPLYLMSCLYSRVWRQERQERQEVQRIMRHVAGPRQGRSSDFRGLRAAREAPDCLVPRAVSRKAIWHETPPEEAPFSATFLLPHLSNEPSEFNNPQDGSNADGAEIPSLRRKSFATLRIGDGGLPKSAKKRQKAPFCENERRRKTEDGGGRTKDGRRKRANQSRARVTDPPAPRLDETPSRLVETKPFARRARQNSGAGNSSPKLRLS
jgi:hypothetical protein